MYGRRVFAALAILVGALFSTTSFVGRAQAQADPKTNREWVAINEPGYHRVEIVMPPARIDGAENFAMRLRVLPTGERWAVIRTDDFAEDEILSDVNAWTEMTALTSADIEVQARYSGDDRSPDTDLYALDGGQWATTTMEFRTGYVQYMRQFELWFVVEGFASGDTVTVDLDRLVYESTGSFGSRVVLDEFGTSPTAVTGEAPTTPATRVALGQNAPNPFNPSTHIPFRLADAGMAQLTVYDLNGALVRTLVSGELSAGTYAATWEGVDASGMPVPSGVYLARLTTGGTQQTRKMLLVK